jgi:hypothetical protein
MSRPTHLFRARPWPTGVLHLVVGFGAIVAALCLDARTVNAEPTTARSPWCVETADSGAPPDCSYDSYLACAVAAIGAGGLCKAESSIPAETTDPSRHRAAALPPRNTHPTTTHRKPNSSPPTAEREKLFREFVEWSRRRSNNQ